MIRWLSIIVVTYMLAALTWWTYLLYRSHYDLTESRLRQIQLEYDLVYGVKDFDLSQMPELAQIKQANTQFQYMIFGEAFVFGLALILGIYYLYRLYKKELAVASQQKNFLLSITHELKSPITSIKLVLETLKKRVLSTDKVQMLSDNGLEETERLSSLVESLLFSAKVESGHEFDLQATNLSNLVSNIAQRYITQHEERYFHTQIDSDIVHDIDAGAMEMMINNLIDNALKYSKKEQPITISLEHKAEKIYLAISDEGKGISKEEKSLIFKKFYRTGSEETRTSQGTGIGLYIAQHIAMAHKSRLRIKDNEPSGSIFYLELSK